MRDREVLVRFRPAGAAAYVLPGTRLVEAAAEAGVLVDVPCGGEGLCANCRVRVLSGAGEPTPVERQWLSDEELRAGWRLACQSVVAGPTEVEISYAAGAKEEQILVHAGDTPQPADDPPVWKRYVELPPPSRGDDLPDVLRLERALAAGPLEIGLPLLRELSARLRQNDFRGTAVLARISHQCVPLLGTSSAALSTHAKHCLFQAVAHSESASEGDTQDSPAVLVDFEPGNTEADAFAVAFDLGTTTLVGELLDLGTGSRRAVEARLNPQARFGDDVLSRILHARQGPDGLPQLHEAIRSALDEMIGRLCSQAGVPRQRVYEVAVAGNTTMQQLLSGVDPSPLGEVPFVPAGGRGLTCLADELGLHVHPRGGGYVMPVIGGFVGGDTVAGILATGLADVGKGDRHLFCAAPSGPFREKVPVPFSDSGPSLFVDIGTNGEIVLLAEGKLSAASTAAGPAFEGARISCGMRGCTGAIEKVVVDGRLRINVIGDVPPAGLCGSGLIDVAAELLRHGLLTPQGRLQTPDQLPAGVPADLAERVILHEGKVAFLLAGEAETAAGRPIVLTQRDLRELQLATGAIRAGIAILLRRAGLGPKDLERVLIGGGFGNFIRRSNAQRIGLLPTEVEHRRIRYMGNTSLAGARLAAISLEARRTAEALARRTAHVDLSADPAFARAFAESMIFPEA